MAPHSERFKAIRIARSHSGSWQSRNPFAPYKPSSRSNTAAASDLEKGPQPSKEQDKQIEGNQTSYQGHPDGDSISYRVPGTQETSQTDDTKNTGLSSSSGSEDDGPKETGWESFKRRMFKENQIPIGQQFKSVLLPHWYTINWLLIFSPIGIALHATKQTPLAVFIVNFIAIIPLAGMLANATEELAFRVGETLGGLLNASFGNAVELIVSIIALVKGEIILVQTSLIGSILSNLLLVLGMCFYFGGINRVHQKFNEAVTSTASSLLALSVGSLILPTAYTWQSNYVAADNSNDEQLSRGTAIILLFVYISMLVFQLKTHASEFGKASEKTAKRKKHKKNHKRSKAKRALGFKGYDNNAEVDAAQEEGVEDDEEESPNLTFVGALIVLCAATALIGVNAEFLVDSISDVTKTYNISEVFVGLILLPIVGNAAEHATAVTVAIKDKMDLAIGVAVGSSIQIALFVLPLSVLIGWWIGQDMTLVFDDFYIAVLFISVILVNYLISDNKSNWLEGIQLMCLYVIIAVAAWFFPKGSNESSSISGGGGSTT